MDDPDFTALREAFAGLASGTVEDTARIESLLSRCWSKLEGSREGGMTPDKISGRIEEMEWNPPFLTFLIERHGGTVLGSKLADLQGWKIDVDLGTATVGPGGRRLVRKRAPPLNVGPIADKIVALILAGVKDELLKWYGDSKVRIWMSVLIPDSSGPNQTIRGRRKKLGAAIERKLRHHAWQKVGVHTFEKSGQG